MKLFNCDGYWKDSGEPFFTEMVVCDGSWDGVEDAKDNLVFYYTDGLPVVGDHGGFVITAARERGKLKKYKVIASYLTFCQLEVEAENEDEAWQLAREADGGDFEPLNGRWQELRDWHISNVSEIKK